MILRRLAAAELRRSLGRKRGDTFLRICAARHIRDRFVLEFHLLVEGIGRAVQQSSGFPFSSYALPFLMGQLPLGTSSKELEIQARNHAGIERLNR